MAADSPETAHRGRIGSRTGRKLTVRDIKAARHTGASYGDAGEGAKQEVLWDTEVPGLGLRVYPSGRRSWCLRYRVNGRRRIVTLGALGLYTLPEARNKAKARLVQLRETRKDPFARPDIIPTISALIPDYTEDRRKRVKASTLATYTTKLAAINRALGVLAVDSVESRDVARAFTLWTDESGPTAANQALRLLRSLLDFAVKRGYREASAPNPASLIERNPEQSRGRELAASEVERIGRELEREVIERPESADTVAAVYLLMLTGARRREITALKWTEVDLDAGCLRLEDSKTGAKVVPLNTPAMKLLSELPRYTGQDRVFPSGRHEVGYAIQYTWKRVRKRAGCEGARLHDLRHTFVTRGLAANYTETLVGKIVGHKSAATTRRYEHLQADPLREAAERIGSSLAADLKGRVEGQVIDLIERKKHG